ncbi:MAG: hypothetical protein M9947_17975 [Thermomicrobiales bacterium]|nr:hypothetical protein [Thermomicrobiales bacterium]
MASEDDQASLTAPAGFFSVEPLASVLVSVPLSDDSDFEVDVGFFAFRLSLTYQPEPLKTIPTGWGTRRT